MRGSFSAAAEALSFTQSAVSQQIAALEREAGTTLVQRSARGVRLTEAGEAVVRHAEAIMARLAEAEAELEAIAGLRGGRLRTAAFESAGATLMPLAIAAFRQKHPARRAVDEHVRARGLRAAAAQRRARPRRSCSSRRSTHADDGIHRVHLLEDPMYLVMPADHPLANRRRVRLADLAGEAWIGGQPDCECNRLIDARLRGRRLRAAVHLRDRRLHGDAGLHRRRRGRLADRRARPDHRARRHRRARSGPRHARCGRSTPPRSTRATARPPPRRCWRSCGTSRPATSRGGRGSS